MHKNWKTWVALAMAGALIYFIAFHWQRFLSDFWSPQPDRSYVGPNLIASIVQYAIILIALALIYPPIRNWIKAQFAHHEKAIKEHVDKRHQELHARHDQLAASLDALHTKVDAVTPVAPANPPAPVPAKPARSSTRKKANDTAPA